MKDIEYIFLSSEYQVVQLSLDICVCVCVNVCARATHQGQTFNA